jgi:CHAD domain-containing protein
VQRRLRQLAEQKDFTHAKDPVEALHDLRVASRRLRAFLDVFEPILGTSMRKRAGKPLRRITRVVRALRDWDVQIGLIEARASLATTDATRAALEHLLERTNLKRDEEATRTANRYEKIRFGRVRDAVSEALEEVLAHISKTDMDPRRLAWNLLAPSVADVERDHPEGSDEQPEQMHQLRIDAKKLRYAVELFEPVLGAEYSALYARLRALQELLGTHHDLAVLGGLVEGTRKELEGRSRKTLAQGLLVLRDDLEADRRKSYEAFRDARYEPSEWRSAIRGALFGPMWVVLHAGGQPAPGSARNGHRVTNGDAPERAAKTSASRRRSRTDDDST